MFNEYLFRSLWWEEAKADRLSQQGNNCPIGNSDLSAHIDNLSRPLRRDIYRFSDMSLPKVRYTDSHTDWVLILIGSQRIIKVVS